MKVAETDDRGCWNVDSICQYCTKNIFQSDLTLNLGKHWSEAHKSEIQLCRRLFLAHHPKCKQLFLWFVLCLFSFV